MSHRAKLREMNLQLPEPPAPKGNYAPVVVHGGIAYVSGLTYRAANLYHSPSELSITFSCALAL